MTAHPPRRAVVRPLILDPSTLLGPSDPAAELTADCGEIACGYCGVRLSVVDVGTGLVAGEGWTINGAKWHPRRSHRIRREPKTTVLLLKAQPNRLGDHRRVALFPVSVDNGWRSVALPITFECHRCKRPTRFDGIPAPV